MTPIERFLRDHAFVHTEAVARADPFNIDYLLQGMTEAQLRVQPHGMNSFAWLFWHIARVEDGYVSCVVMSRGQLFNEENWSDRLNVSRRDVSTSKDEVRNLSEEINLPALWDYRDEVGTRTREMVKDLWPDKWDAGVDVSDVRLAVEAGVCSSDAEQFIPGRSRESALLWWGLNHTLMHLGQAGMLRGVVKNLSL